MRRFSVLVHHVEFDEVFPTRSRNRLSALFCPRCVCICRGVSACVCEIIYTSQCELCLCHKSKMGTGAEAPEPSPSSRDQELPSPSEKRARAKRGGAVEPGLPQPLQKQLAEDIEHLGGIGQFVDKSVSKRVRSLCESNPTDYGALGSPLRRQIANRIYKWKALYKKGKYEQEVLGKLGLLRPVPPVHQKKEATVHQSTDSNEDESQGSEELVSDQLSSSGSESDAGTIARSISRAKGRQTRPTPLKQTTRKPSVICDLPRFDISLVDEPHVKRAAMDKNKKTSKKPPSIPPDAESIRVDERHPERNGPVMIFPVNDIESLEPLKVYPGFLIMFEMDLRFAFDSKKDEVEYFSGKIVGPNQVLLRVPSWPYSLFSERDRKLLEIYLKPNFMNAVDAKRNDFLENKEERLWKYYLLEFDEDVELSAKIIFKAPGVGDDEILPSQIIPMKYTHPDMNHKTNTKHFVSMWVARTDQGAEQYGAFKKNPTTLTASALDALGQDGGF